MNAWESHRYEHNLPPLNGAMEFESETDFWLARGWRPEDKAGRQARMLAHRLQELIHHCRWRLDSDVSLDDLATWLTGHLERALGETNGRTPNGTPAARHAEDSGPVETGAGNGRAGRPGVGQAGH